MGIIRMGPPTEIINILSKKFDVKSFIETGTFHGGTAYWASHVFESVITIEMSEVFYQRAKAKYHHVNNINYLFGHTKDRLKEAVSGLRGPAILWLDAHWSGGETYGEKDQCPIMEEIEIINQSPYHHFLFIDDARLFTSPPPRPLLIEQWPDITNIITLLNNRDRYIIILEDVIIAVPVVAKTILAQYGQEVNTTAWDEYGRQHRLSCTQKGLYLISSNLKKVLLYLQMVVNSILAKLSRINKNDTI